MIALRLDNHKYAAEVCHFCGATIAIEEAGDEGWIPSFFDMRQRKEILHSSCPSCTEEHLVYDEDYKDYTRKDK